MRERKQIGTTAEGPIQLEQLTAALGHRERSRLAGAYIELEALMDLICVVSSRSYDRPIEGWTLNAKGGPTKLILEVN